MEDAEFTILQLRKATRNFNVYFESVPAEEVKDKYADEMKSGIFSHIGDKAKGLRQAYFMYVCCLIW